MVQGLAVYFHHLLGKKLITGPYSVEADEPSTSPDSKVRILFSFREREHLMRELYHLNFRPDNPVRGAKLRFLFNLRNGVYRVWLGPSNDGHLETIGRPPTTQPDNGQPDKFTCLLAGLEGFKFGEVELSSRPNPIRKV